MAGGNKKYSVVEAGNLGFGQVGSIFLDASGAASPPTGLAFIAITFLEDSIFDASGGLVAEDENQYANTQAAAHNESDGSETATQGSGGLQIDASNTFPQGATIFGRWSEIDLTSGMVIAYIGQMLNLRLGLRSFATRSAAIARDLWSLVNDPWELEFRKWEDVL